MSKNLHTISGEVAEIDGYIPVDIPEKHNRYKGTIAPYNPHVHKNYAIIANIWPGYSGVKWTRDMELRVFFKNRDPRPVGPLSASEEISLVQNTVYYAMYEYMLKKNIEAGRASYDAQLLYFPQDDIMDFVVNYLDGLRAGA